MMPNAPAKIARRRSPIIGLSMSRHPFRHRFGFFVSKVGVCPKESEESEIAREQEPSEMHLDSGNVRAGAEYRRNPFRGFSCADSAEQQKRDREYAQRHFVAQSAIADRFDRAAVEPWHEKQQND